MSTEPTQPTQVKHHAAIQRIIEFLANPGKLGACPNNHDAVRNANCDLLVVYGNDPALREYARAQLTATLASDSYLKEWFETHDKGQETLAAFGITLTPTAPVTKVSDIAAGTNRVIRTTAEDWGLDDYDLDMGLSTGHATIQPQVSATEKLAYRRQQEEIGWDLPD